MFTDNDETMMKMAAIFSRSALRRIVQVVLFLSLLIMVSGVGWAETPRVFLLDPALLEKMKQSPSPQLLQAARSEGDAVIMAGPFTVMSNPMTPPSGDKHDYMSLPRYDWLDPKSPPDHPHYLHRDGYANPEAAKIPDHANMGKMQAAVHSLALAYYFTGEARYADRAALLLRTWFLNPDTLMRPNLQYAQSGHVVGIIDARGMLMVIDALGLLESYPGWTRKDRDGMKAWFTAYADWLVNSENGQGESRRANNHGSWYACQLVALQLYLGRPEDARKTLGGIEGRIRHQIKPDGSQPLELVRKNSFIYSTFNLTALMNLADYGDRVGVDLWNYKPENGGGIRDALDFLSPYTTGDRKWPYTEFDFKAVGLRPSLVRAAAHYHDPKYQLLAEKLRANQKLDDLLLTAPTGPE